MKKIVYLLFLILLSSCGGRTSKTPAADASDLVEVCQVDLFFPLTKEFDWANVEKQNKKVKERFIKNLPEEFEWHKQYGDMSSLEACLHIMDFNGDNLDDVIYNGYIAGSEAEYINIYMNIGNSFVKIFTETQHIHKMVFKNGKVNKLYIRDGGCCCDYIGTNKIFSVDYSSELPKINPVSQMQFVNISREEYPDKYFDKPIKFEVLNDKYNIRFSPVIDDTTRVGYCFDIKNGNSLGKIKSGSIGYALAEKADTTGRTWWFVALTPNTGIYEPIYYDETILPNSYKLGWISSRFVKEIDD